MRAAREGIDWRFATAAAILIPLIVAVGAVPSSLPQTISIGTALLVGVAAFAMVLLMVIGTPVLYMSLLLVVHLLGWNPTVYRGSFDLLLSDVAYGTLLLSLLFARQQGERIDKPWIWPLFGFIAIVALTIPIIVLRDPSFANDAFISWLRLVQTGSLVLVAPTIIKDERDIRWILRAILLAATAGVVYSALSLPISSWLTVRAGVLQNVNSFALVTGMCLVIAIFTDVVPKTTRVACVGLGVLGLLLAKSLGATAATAIAITIGGLHGRVQVRRVGRAMVAAGLAVLATGAVLFNFRPADDPRNSGFWRSSTGQRIIYASAGWELFVRNPVLGVGWQRSSEPDVILGPDIAPVLLRRFPEASVTQLAPRLEDSDYGAAPSVHNMYVQILAEIGLVGIAILVLLARSIRRVVKAVWQSQEGRGIGLVMILIAVWWNENPLYGGQVETVTFVVLFGVAGGLAGLRRARIEGARSAAELSTPSRTL